MAPEFSILCFMNPTANSSSTELQIETPLCPVFGTCGGCTYQHLSYAEELRVKEQQLHGLFKTELKLPWEVFESIVASPKHYHYRNRLDLEMRRSQRQIMMGFQSPELRKVVPVSSCAIAMEEISDFMPQLEMEAAEKLPENYRTANLVVRCGDDGRVFWGGIGRRSLEMKEEDFLWTEVNGRRVYYSLETFFQANLSILPRVMEIIRSLLPWDQDTLFLDLYSGVGLFGICLADLVGKVVMVEECPGSIKLAKYNIHYHQLSHVEMMPGKVENELPKLTEQAFRKIYAMIDPPRAGLSRQVAESLSASRLIKGLLYLSCHPQSLVRDLKIFIEKGWKVEKIHPFDFFPRTRHLETLVLLTP